MWQYIALLALVAGVFADCNVATKEQCDPVQYVCCSNQFTKDINATDCVGNFYEDAECYRRKIEGAYTSGPAAAQQVCSAWTKYQQCLGISQADCFSIRFNVLSGKTVAEAKYLATIIGNTKFVCGAGFNTFMNDDVTCLGEVFHLFKGTFKQCREEFSTKLTTNPMNRCIDFRQLLGCVQLPFEKQCGLEAGWWGCEYQRSGVAPWLPECSEQCTATNTNIRAKAPEK